jgi:hypothetical protein
MTQPRWGSTASGSFRRPFGHRPIDWSHRRDRRPLDRFDPLPHDRRLRAGRAMLLAALLGLVISAVTASPAAASNGDKGGKGEVYVVHGIVGQVLDIYLDAKLVLAKADPKTIVGPLKLDSGSHRLTLRAGDKKVAQAKFEVGSGQSVDVVAHRRADR